MSTKYAVPYWFNAQTGESRWTDPNERGDFSIEESSKRRRIESDVVESRNCVDGIAIIVPFRDIHPEQNRSMHVSRFIPEMSRSLFLSIRIYL